MYSAYLRNYSALSNVFILAGISLLEQFFGDFEVLKVHCYTWDSKGTSLRQTTSLEPSYVKICCELWSVGDLPKREEKYLKTKNLQLYISPTWGAAHVQPVATKLGNSLRLTNVIIRSEFGIDWYSDFGSGEVSSMACPIGTKTRPYHMQPCQACRWWVQLGWHLFDFTVNSSLDYFSPRSIKEYFSQMPALFAQFAHHKLFLLEFA